MKYYVTSVGYQAPWPEFETLTKARKYLSDCKREDKGNSKWVLKDENQNSKDSYFLKFGCNLYSAAMIHKL